MDSNVAAFSTKSRRTGLRLRQHGVDRGIGNELQNRAANGDQGIGVFHLGVRSVVDQASPFELGKKLLSRCLGRPIDRPEAFCTTQTNGA